MAVFNEPIQWEHPLGNNADTSTLPDDAVATAGIASLQKLFQIINATPLEAGGIAPDREDVNALFKYLGDSIFYTMNGGVPSYNADYDYVAGRVVLYNGNLYKCIQANGVSSTVVAPGSDTAYWQRLDNFVRSVNGVNADASGNVTVKTSFAVDYSAGVTLSNGGTVPTDGIAYVLIQATQGILISINDNLVMPPDFFGQRTRTSYNCIVKNGDKISVSLLTGDLYECSITVYPFK